MLWFTLKKYTFKIFFDAFYVCLNCSRMITLRLAFISDHLSVVIKLNGVKAMKFKIQFTRSEKLSYAERFFFFFDVRWKFCTLNAYDKETKKLFTLFFTLR